MRKETVVVQDRSGNAVAGAEVYIRDQGDNSLVTLYSDDGVTTTANPVTTNNDGQASFYTANNTLKHQVYIEGVLQNEHTHIQHFDLDDITTFIWTLLDDADAATARATLGLTIGTNVQAYDADLAALAANSTDGLWAHTGAGTGAARTITGTANEVTVTNGDGVAGNPTMSLPTPIKTHSTVLLVSDPNGDAITTGDGKAYWPVPAQLNGCNLVAAAAALTTVSSSGAPSVQIHNLTQTADMLSTNITIDANELHSKDATTPAAVDAANDDVATGDLLRIDIDAAGTGAKGLSVILEFRQP